MKLQILAVILYGLPLFMAITISDPPLTAEQPITRKTSSTLSPFMYSRPHHSLTILFFLFTLFLCPMVAHVYENYHV